MMAYARADRGEGRRDVIEYLKPIPFFSSLNDRELLTVAEKLRIKRYARSSIILYEQDTNEYMYIILYGKVKAVQMTEEGKETILAIHGAGDFFGEMSLIDEKTVPATVMATEDTLTAIISKKDFYALLFSQDKILIELLKILCLRLRKSWDMIQMLNFKNATQRLKMLFAALSEEYGNKTQEGIVLGIKLTHRDIANMAGITRETATRVIDRLRKDREITILKDRRLRLSSDFLTKDLRGET